MFLVVIQILLAVIFISAGISKFVSGRQIEAYNTYGYPQWFRTVTGIAECITAILLIMGLWNHQSALIGGLLVVVIMAGAIITHIITKDKFKNVLMPIALLVLGVIVIWQKALIFFG